MNNQSQRVVKLEQNVLNAQIEERKINECSVDRIIIGQRTVHAVLADLVALVQNVDPAKAPFFDIRERYAALYGQCMHLAQEKEVPQEPPPAAQSTDESDEELQVFPSVIELTEEEESTPAASPPFFKEVWIHPLQALGRLWRKTS